MGLDSKDGMIAVAALAAVYFFAKGKVKELFGGEGDVFSTFTDARKGADTISTMYENWYEQNISYDPAAPFKRDKAIAENRFKNDIGVETDSSGNRYTYIPQPGVGGGFGITKATEYPNIWTGFDTITYQTSRYEGYNASKVNDNVYNVYKRESGIANRGGGQKYDIDTSTKEGRAIADALRDSGASVRSSSSGSDYEYGKAVVVKRSKHKYDYEGDKYSSPAGPGY